MAFGSTAKNPFSLHTLGYPTNNGVSKTQQKFYKIHICGTFSFMWLGLRCPGRQNNGSWYCIKQLHIKWACPNRNAAVAPLLKMDGWPHTCGGTVFVVVFLLGLLLRTLSYHNLPLPPITCFILQLPPGKRPNAEYIQGGPKNMDTVKKHVKSLELRWRPYFLILS